MGGDESSRVRSDYKIPTGGNGGTSREGELHPIGKSPTSNADAGCSRIGQFDPFLCSGFRGASRVKHDLVDQYRCIRPENASKNNDGSEQSGNNYRTTAGT